MCVFAVVELEYLELAIRQRIVAVNKQYKGYLKPAQGSIPIPEDSDAFHIHLSDFVDVVAGNQLLQSWLPLIAAVSSVDK